MSDQNPIVRSVEVCGSPCDVQGAAAGQIYCLTPEAPGLVDGTTCDVRVTIEEQEVLRDSPYPLLFFHL